MMNLGRILPLLALLAACSMSFAQNAVVLEGAVIFDGIASRPQKNSVIVIQHGKITGFGPRREVIIPEGAKRINLRGKFIIPGLIDGHVHASSSDDLLRMLAWGVTSVGGMFETVGQAAALERWTALDSSRAPQVYAAAPIFAGDSAWFSLQGIPADTAIDQFPSTPEEARLQVKKAKGLGMKRLKIFYDTMDWCRDSLSTPARMDREIMAAIIEEAWKQKLFTTVHAPKLADAREALDAGAMSLAHGVLDDYLDASALETMHSRNVYYVPTFSMFEFLADGERFLKGVLADKRFRSTLPPRLVAEYTSPEYLRRHRERYPNAGFIRSHLPALRDNMLTLVKNYGVVVMGSDLAVLPGIGAHLELEYMVKAGLTPYQAITMATTFGGQYLGAATKVGTIEVGRQADLLILNADPFADIRNTRNIHTIVKRGRMFTQKALLKGMK